MTLRADPLSFLSRDALEALEELIDRRVAEALATRESAASSAPSSPYMTVAEAANYLRCRRQRIDDLLSQRRLSRFKDGSRTLLSRDEVARYVRAGRDSEAAKRV